MLVVSGKKLAFRCYLYGYLNDYVNNLYLKNGIKPNLPYKEYKVGLATSYLKLPVKYSKLISFLLNVISHFEVALYLLIETVQFVESVCILTITKHYITKNKNFFLGLNANKGILSIFFQSSGIDKNNITIIKLPFIKTAYDDYQSVSVFCGLNICDLLKSFSYSIMLTCFQKHRYGRRDLLFRSDSSFLYFLVYFFVNKSDISNNFFFVNQIDRWAHLFGNSSQNTYMIQHGKQLMTIPAIRIGSVKYAYYIDDNQRVIFEKTLFNNKPIARYRSDFRFTSNNKIIHNGLKNVLVVCNNIYRDTEIKILNICSKKHCNLYLKPHPLDSISYYEHLMSTYRFIILGNVDYPKVDIVISYDSTLADDYEKVGTDVIRYGELNFMEKLLSKID